MTHEKPSIKSVARSYAGFVAVCILSAIAGAAVTLYLCVSMSGGMDMPGGWTMSMMWMRMPGQTWLLSAVYFLLMWIAMMIPMMMPSALPTFLKTARQSSALFLMVSAYFAVWLAVGACVYVIGMAFATLEMQSDVLSRAVPLLSGILLIIMGIIQFTHWKMFNLLRCRSPLGCTSSPCQYEKSFLLGCKQGVACCICCTIPMAVQLVLGIMNPLVMLIVALVITVEKLLPRPDITVRFVGFGIIILGVISIFH